MHVLFHRQRRGGRWRGHGCGRLVLVKPYLTRVAPRDLPVHDDAVRRDGRAGQIAGASGTGVEEAATHLSVAGQVRIELSPGAGPVGVQLPELTLAGTNTEDEDEVAADRVGDGAAVRRSQRDPERGVCEWSDGLATSDLPQVIRAVAAAEDGHLLDRTVFGQVVVVAIRERLTGAADDGPCPRALPELRQRTMVHAKGIPGEKQQRSAVHRHVVRDRAGDLLEVRRGQGESCPRVLTAGTPGGAAVVAVAIDLL